jgi:dTDP-4-dehydrorhamnose reductase
MSLYDSILITGAGGMLGHALTDALLARGINSIGLTREQLDIADPASAERAFAQHKPTLVLNCAAHTKVDLCEQEAEKADAINGRAVGNLAKLCRASGAAVVHISTDFVFDGALHRPYRADDPVNPLSAYGRSKLLGETELKKNHPDRWLLVRTAWVYGRHGANFPRTMVQAAQAGKPLSVVNDQMGSPTHTPDLADAVLRLLDSGAKGVWHVTNSGETNWFDFARATLSQFGISAAVSPLSSAQWKQMRPNSAVRPGYSVLDTGPYTRQTGHKMRPWTEALVEFHKLVQQSGF